MDGMRKGMDRIRRSIRQSFRKKSKKSPSLTGEALAASSATNSTATSQPPQWHSDEAAVRAGNCSFSVKYLGCTEVFESRGMQICEEALKQLRNSNRKSQRAVLHISGDGLRVVDATSSQLIVDQTIEKVSFCAPDRNHDRGFSYICRDGTTRRWLCHGFVAVRESGERLSHAVGCAFQICLEKKQKRDRDVPSSSSPPVTPSGGTIVSLPPDNIVHHVHTPVKSSQSTPNNFQTPPRSSSAVTLPSTSSSNWLTRQTSARSSIVDRMKNPQEYKASSPPPLPTQTVINPHMRDRPHVTPEMLQRQQSLRVFSTLKSATPFKRNMSLEHRNPPPPLESPASIRWRQTSLDVPTTPAAAVNNTNVPVWEDGTAILDEEQEEVGDIAQLCQKISFDLDDMSASLPQQQNGHHFQRYTTTANNNNNHHHNNNVPYANLLPKSISSPLNNGHNNLERRSESAKEARQRFAERAPRQSVQVHPPYVNSSSSTSSNGWTNGDVRHPSSSLTVDWNGTNNSSTPVNDPFNADWVNVQKNSSTTNPFLT